jgi:hypothetical protein
MALTLPASFNNHSIKQNWLFQLHYDDESAFTGLSFYDTTVSQDYYGSITNKPSIREKIDLINSKSSTSNVSLTVANFKYLGDDFSAELHGGTRKYINRIVKIYIQPNDASSLSDCLLIYTGKLKSISHNIDTINLNIEAKRVWDGVEVPTVKTSKNNYYPIAYGDYRPNASQSNVNSTGLTFNSSAGIDEYRKRKTLYPIPIEERRGDTVFALTGDWTQSDRSWSHYYEKSLDSFLPLANDSTDATVNDAANETYKDGKATRFHQNLLKSSFNKMTEFTEFTNQSPFTWDYASGKADNAFDGDFINTSTSVQCNISGTFGHNKRAFLKYNMPQLTGYPSKLQVHFVISGSISLSSASGNGEIRVELLDKSFGAEDVLGYYSFTGNQVGNKTFKKIVGGSTVNIDTTSAAILENPNDSDTEWLASGSGWGENLQFNIRCVTVAGVGDEDLTGTLFGNFNIHDVAIQADTQLDFTETTKTGKLVASKFIDDIQYVYSGGDGLPDNGWNSNSAITTIIAAHRDILHRNTSYTNSNTPTNWSAINTAKDWAIRYWCNEPKDLKNVLEELQFNGGFIFRFNGQNQGEYIFIPDSISTDHTINTDDLENINLSLTSINDIKTTIDIEYEKHPAINGYVSKVTGNNSTAETNLNIGTNENKKTVRLNALVSAPATSPSSNVNDDWYTYYNNIIGDQKILVSATVISPSLYGIDVGDFVEFGTMPVDPFGESWSGKDFIVTSVSRQFGKLQCEFREV